MTAQGWRTPGLRLRRRQCVMGLAGMVSHPAVWSAATAATSVPTSPLHTLAERYFDALLNDDPFLASSCGLDSPELARRIPMDIEPQQRQALADLQQRLLAELAALQPTPAEHMLWALLHFELSDALAGHAFPDHLLPLNHMGDSPLFALANVTHNGLSRLDSVQGHHNHLERLRQLPRWCAQARRNLQEGLQTGVVQPRVIVVRMLPMLRQLQQPGGNNPFLAPLGRLASFDPADRAKLTQAYHQVLHQQLLPALAELVGWVSQHYLPQARPSAGLWALPQGQAWYAQCLRSATTTTLDADTIHALGRSEIARLEQAIATLAAQLGYRGPVADFWAWYDRRPELRPFRTEAEVLAAYRALQQRIEAKMPSLFHQLPKARLEIQPEPALTRDTASDSYHEPAADGSRPGVFHVVIRNPAAYDTTGMATLLLHEGQPGHHHQIALAQELPLTRLQRFTANNAFAEGWALYAETLGHALGVYDTPDAQLGHLRDAMLRAVRLVVDTGLHARGWSREQAIALLQRHTGSSAHDARAQIERYMVWPGQATSYTIGRLRIEAARDRAQAVLGSGFLLADFHQQVLGDGALPLSVLDEKIKRWLTAAGKPKA